MNRPKVSGGSNSIKVKRSAHVTSAQKTALINFIDANPKLKSGKYDLQFTYKDGNKLWEKAAENLNAIPGSRKDWKSWRKCWQDIKNDVRAKSAATKKYINATGGGPPSTITMTPDEERVEQIIGTGAIHGHKNIQETSVNFQLPGDSPERQDSRDNEDECAYVQDENYEEIIDMSIVDIQQMSLPLNETQPTENFNTVVETPILPRSAKRPRVRLARLQNAIKSTDAVAGIVKEKAKQKEEYQIKKLKLIELKIEIQSRIANAKEKKADAAVRQAIALESIASNLDIYMFNQTQ